MNAAFLQTPDATRTPCVETLSGNSIDLNCLNSPVLNFDEIALVLSRLPVLLGHQVTLHPYTVAHHCLWMMAYVLWNTGSPRAALYALVYRAHEAYLGSVPCSVGSIEPVSRLQAQVQSCVHYNLNLPKPNSELARTLRTASRIATAIEMQRFLPNGVPDWYVQEVPAAALDIAWHHTLAGQAYADMLTAYEWLRELEREPNV
jgi:hypothetical protein